LMPAMSVMENVFLEDLPSNRFGVLKKNELHNRTQEIIDTFELPIKPTDIVSTLSAAHQQMVEIMKAYRRDTDIIAFDEPTAPLASSEITILFKLIRKLKERGKVILYVSHRLAEIFQITDEIVVLKDGRMVKSLKTAHTNEKELIVAMVGRDIGNTYADLRRNANTGEPLLEVTNLTTDYLCDVSFELLRGEVLGFAGLVGAGRTEVMRAIFGVDPIRSGEIRLDGKPVRFKSPRDAIDGGIALCPEDRKEDGLVLNRSISDNVTMPVLDKVIKRGFLSREKESKLAEAAILKYTIRTPTPDKVVLELSGGNQQKVILGRWTTEAIFTKVLILDEPTKGIDVGAKAEIYQIVCDFALAGMGVIFISSELTEVLNVCDRIIVMHNGRITGRVERQEATEELVLQLAML